MLNKILIVDDEEQVRKTIRVQLKDTDYVVIEAEDGEKAIEVLKDENVLEVDAIICDVRMPKIGGVEAVGRTPEIVGCIDGRSSWGLIHHPVGAIAGNEVIS